MPSTPAAQQHKTAAQRQVVEYLTTVTLGMYDAANEHRFAEVAAQHFAPCCGGFHDMGAMKWADLSAGAGAVAHCEAYLKRHPQFHTVVEDVSVTVGDRLDRAVVWMLRSDSGLSDGWRRESVLRMTWTKGPLGWLCTETTDMRHVPLFTAFGDAAVMCAL